MTSVLVLYYFGAGTVTPRFGPPSRTSGISFLLFFYFGTRPRGNFKPEWAANANTYVGITPPTVIRK